MISFSGAAKAEVCRLQPQNRCCALAECFGILLFCNSFASDGIRIITECREFAALLPKLFKKSFSVNFDQIPENDNGGKSAVEEELQYGAGKRVVLSCFNVALHKLLVDGEELFLFVLGLGERLDDTHAVQILLHA